MRARQETVCGIGLARSSGASLESGRGGRFAGEGWGVYGGAGKGGPWGILGHPGGVENSSGG
eukprot:scaffold272838_cov28-Tisochrysis_lutea.AAC.3